jgi:pyrimidine-nucleoside phosphorylase
MELGAGRVTKEDVIDLAVGVVLNKKRGDKVGIGDTIAYIHANDESRIEKAKNDILRNYIIHPEAGNNIPLIYDVIR